MKTNVGKLVRCFYYSNDGRIIGCKTGVIIAELKNEDPEAYHYEILIDGTFDIFPLKDIQVIEEGKND